MEVIYILHVAVCVLLVCVILLQDGKTGGLVSVADNTQAVFGAKGASNFLTKLTTVLAVLFMCLSLFLAYNAANQSSQSILGEDFEPAATQDTGPEVSGSGAMVMDPETGEMKPMSENAIKEIEVLRGDDVPEEIRNPQSETVTPEGNAPAATGDKPAAEDKPAEGDQAAADDNNGDNGDNQDN